jgi:hypothetical protein
METSIDRIRAGSEDRRSPHCRARTRGARRRASTEDETKVKGETEANDGRRVEGATDRRRRHRRRLEPERRSSVGRAREQIRTAGREVSAGTLSNTLQTMKKRGMVKSGGGKWMLPKARAKRAGG